MTWVLLVVVVALVVAVATGAHLALSARASLGEAQARLAAAAASADDAERRNASAAAAAQAQIVSERNRAQHAADRATQAEARLALDRQEAGRSSAPADAARLKALWSLALLDQDRTWRLTMAMPQGTDDKPLARNLADALEGEVSRMREETGTPGTLDMALDGEPQPGDALLVLRGVQGMLAVLGRHSQAFDLYVGTDEGCLVATIACDDFDGPDTVADETTALLRAVQPAGGELDIDKDVDGRLRARFILPAR